MSPSPNPEKIFERLRLSNIRQRFSRSPSPAPPASSPAPPNLSPTPSVSSLVPSSSAPVLASVSPIPTASPPALPGLSASSPSQSDIRTEPNDHVSKLTVAEAKASQKPSRARENVMKVFNGFTLLANMIEPFLEGTPFKMPVSVFIAVADAVETVHDTKESADALFNNLTDRLSIVSEHFAKSNDRDSKSIVDIFAKKLVQHARKIDDIRKAPDLKAFDAKGFKSDLEMAVVQIERETQNFHVSPLLLSMSDPLRPTLALFSARVTYILYHKQIKYSSDDPMKLTVHQARVLLTIERDTKDIRERLFKNDVRSWNRAPSAQYEADTAEGQPKRQPCTEGTRIGVLQRIADWASDPSLPPIFCLSGMAGTGKSTIAYSICQRFSEQHSSDVSLAATFFCSRQVGDLRRLQNVIPTIAYQLARHSRSFAQALVEADESAIQISGRQVQKLLLAPWESSLEERSDTFPSTLIVIDALDEIEDDGGEALLRQLVEATRKVGKDALRGLKILVTSRPHPLIVNTAASLSPDSIYRLEDIKKEYGRQDILTYLVNRLPDLARDHYDFIETLADRCDGLFIYAATATRTICPPKKPLSLKQQFNKLKALLPERTGTHSSDLKAVYGLYAQILEDSIPETSRTLQLPILHRIICAFQPLPTGSLAQVVAADSEEDVDEEAVQKLVEALHSVLYISGADHCIYIYHKSFSDFLLDGRLSTAELACDLDIQNAAVARACFRIMCASLRFNICNLPSSYLFDSEVQGLSESIKTNILDVAGLEYACRFWTSHLVQVLSLGEESQILCELLSDFLKEKVLFWIEAMNLIDAKSSCTDGLNNVVAWVRQQSMASAELGEAIARLVRFSRSFLQTATSLSTPHLYISCLATEFGLNAENCSRWKRMFKDVPRIDCTGVSNYGGVLTHINVGSDVNAVAFSSDGTYIVSGSDDGSVRIWDASTGQELHKLHGHTGWVNSVGFSTDGTRVVSGSSDRSVRIWDASTGKELHKLDGHTDWVRSVGFSTDGTRVVSGSSDSSVRIWDASMGQELHDLDGHTDWVRSVGFSADGTRVVSGSSDSSVRIWDASTGKELHKLDGHVDGVNSVAFSTDDTRVVSGSDDRSVRIWDASTGQELHKLDGHVDGVSSVAFSTDDTRVVSGSGDTSIRIWDASTGQELHKLDGHTSWVRSVGFSGDGTRAVSGSDGGSVRIWDASTGRKLHKPDGHAGCVYSVAFSTEGIRIVSGSDDKSVRIWDASTGQELHKLDGHTDWARSVGFSADGTQVVSGSNDRSVRIWDALTGKELHKLDGHTDRVNSVAFSADGTRVVSGSEDGSVRIWDASMGKELHKLDGHTNSVGSVGFSADDIRVISGSGDGSVRIWDASTGKELHKLDGHTDWVRSVGFSADSTRVVSGSDDTSVRIWDASMGQELYELDGHTDWVRSVGLSPDGARVVSGSDDMSVRIWDASTGRELHKLDGHTGWVNSVAFSADGTRAVSCSEDGSIRIWDVPTEADSKGPGWISTSEGWIVSKQDRRRLLWLPPHIFPGLYAAHCRLVISQAGRTTIDFSEAKLGTEWAQCYQDVKAR